MPMKRQVLSLLQTAGQSLYEASQALQAMANQHADQVRSSMSANPFDTRSDAQFDEWKTVARLSKAVAQIEDELKKVYGLANAWQSIGTLPPTMMAALPLQAFPVETELEVLQSLEATDVVEKRLRHTQSKDTPKVKSAVRRPTSRSRTLSGNTAKLLSALELRLNGKSHNKVNRSRLALEIGLPKGSISAALIKLKELGYLLEDEHGSLRLSKKS